ncbi:hypothetical protein [Streptomyces sp. NBC_00258]|uniref:hypothetical protein n=1 Tax=Streptomyces sp. NBC_00258 TaxID=2903642 RepID=UPI002E281A22|nr:hypothetical protein [Streptomyces sp. NBC_00258]
MTREQALTQAVIAADNATDLAREADRMAHHNDFRPQTPAFAAAGALWADVAVAYAAIAQALPETTPED